MDAEGDCRLYPSELPSIDEIVMVRVCTITDAGVYCELLEYGNIKGLIIAGELSRKKYSSIHLIKINKIEAATILRVDPIKKYVDLSRKRVSKIEFAKCVRRYALAKQSHNVVLCAAKKLDKLAQNLYDEFLYGRILKHNTLYNYFYKVFTDSLDDDEIDGYSHGERIIFDEVKIALKKRFALPIYRIRVSIDASTMHRDGVFELKRALLEGKAVDQNVSVNLVKPPTFVVSLNTTDKDNGLSIVHKAIGAMKGAVLKGGGHFQQSGEPSVTSDKGNLDGLCDKYENLYDDELRRELEDTSEIDTSERDSSE